MAEEHGIFQIKHLPRGTDRNQDSQVATVLGTAAEQPDILSECLRTLAWRRSGRGSWQHRMKQNTVLTQRSLPDLYLSIQGKRAKYQWIKSMKLN